MAFSFKRRESVRNGFQRMADDQLAGILADLKDLDDPDAIHDARKRCKKLRSLFRLIRSGVPKKWRAAENRRLRRVANLLGAARDAEVRAATFEKLLAGPATALKTGTAKLHAFLRAEIEGHQDRAQSGQTLDRVTRAVKECRRRCAERKLSESGWTVLGNGIERSCRRAREAFQHALADSSEPARHEWRKRVKDVWYHLRLLRNLDPKSLRPRIEKLSSLCDLLGDEHDLAVLLSHLESLPATLMDPETAEALNAIIVRRSEDLFRVATRLGHLALDDDPKDFVSDLKKRWKKWRR
jgi:CHAD domain-containing protein